MPGETRNSFLSTALLDFKIDLNFFLLLEGRSGVSNIECGLIFWKTFAFNFVFLGGSTYFAGVSSSDFSVIS